MPQKEWEIWSEGYAATGERGTATFHGKYMGESFDDAVEEFKKHYSGRVDTSEFLGKKRHSIWGCHLFQTESGARKSFG